MRTQPWRLQDAKTHFSQLVETALRGEAQHVTRRGREAVVVLSESDYRRLTATARAQAPGFVEHLLAMPRSDEPSSEGKLVLRELDFE
jgi:prevent-host-death family protein